MTSSYLEVSFLQLNVMTPMGLISHALHSAIVLITNLGQLGQQDPRGQIILAVQST